MTFVVIAKRINMILPLVEKMECVYIIKVFKAKAYCLYTGSRPLKEVMKEIERKVAEKYSGILIVNVLEIYNEVTDIAPHIAKEDKHKYAYYEEAKKELTNEEVEEFKKKMGL